MWRGGAVAYRVKGKDGLREVSLNKDEEGICPSLKSLEQTNLQLLQEEDQMVNKVL
jgi:hypothetical protein